MSVGGTLFLFLYHHALYCLNLFICIFLWFKTWFQIFTTLWENPEISFFLVLSILFADYSNSLCSLLHNFLINTFLQWNVCIFPQSRKNVHPRSFLSVVLFFGDRYLFECSCIVSVLTNILLRLLVVNLFPKLTHTDSLILLRAEVCFFLLKIQPEKLSCLVPLEYWID